MLDAFSAGASIPADTTLEKLPRPRISEQETGRPASAEARTTLKTRLVFPLPETPVTAVRTPEGIAASMPRRLFARAPRTSIRGPGAVSYTHLRAHETDSYLVCRLLLEKK